MYSEVPVMQKKVTRSPNIPIQGSLSSNSRGRFFQPQDQVVPISNKLVQLVAFGREDEVKVLLNQLPQHLAQLTNREAVTDCAGRKFSSISSIGYALWSRDWHMFHMMYECLRDLSLTETNYDLAEKVRQSLLVEFKEIASKGVHYSLDNQEVRGETHFSLQPLLRELSKCVKKEGNKLLQEQKKLPINVVQEICRDDRPLYPVPSFKEEKLPRKQQYYDWNTDKVNSWYPSSPSETANGSPTEAVIRGDWLNASTYMLHPDRDLKAMTALDQVRAKDIRDFEVLLSTPFKKPQYSSSYERLNDYDLNILFGYNQ